MIKLTWKKKTLTLTKTPNLITLACVAAYSATIIRGYHFSAPQPQRSDPQGRWDWTRNWGRSNNLYNEEPRASHFEKKRPRHADIAFKGNSWAYQIKSLQCPQNTGCLKNRLMNAWFWTFLTVFLLNAPARSIMALGLCSGWRGTKGHSDWSWAGMSGPGPGPDSDTSDMTDGEEEMNRENRKEEKHLWPTIDTMLFVWSQDETASIQARETRRGLAVNPHSSIPAILLSSRLERSAAFLNTCETRELQDDWAAQMFTRRCATHVN